MVILTLIIAEPYFAKLGTLSIKQQFLLQAHHEQASSMPSPNETRLPVVPVMETTTFYGGIETRGWNCDGYMHRF